LHETLAVAAADLDVGFQYQELCWTCAGECLSSNLIFVPEGVPPYMSLGAQSQDDNVSQIVRIEGGNSYTLSYLLGAGTRTPNRWKVVVETTDGPAFTSTLIDLIDFIPITDENTDSSLSHTFSVPAGASRLRISFINRQARPPH
jgi:hypothetical protein